MKNFFIKLNKLLRPFSIYSTENPIAEEIEQVARFETHLLLMVKARWVFGAFCVVYGIITAIICHRASLDAEVQKLLPPLLAFFIVMIFYNSWYHYSYHWFSHLSGLRQLQMLVDVVVVIFIIHFTGGIASWVWVIFPLLIIESAIVFERQKDTWLITWSAIILYVSLIGLESVGVITQIKMPFHIYEVGYGMKIGGIYLSWVVFIIICAALVSTYLMRLQRGYQTKLKKRVVRDNLTNLYNRRHFFYSLKSEFERARRFDHIVSVLFLDVDNFKTFNDALGHLEGDRLLQSVATILKKNIRSDIKLTYDVDMPFRYGGDEFAIILPETTPSSGLKKAEKLRQKIALEGVLNLAERIRYEVEAFCEENFKITVSIGVATYPLHGNSVEQIVQAADNALYVAKQAGRNGVCMAESEWEKNSNA